MWWWFVVGHVNDNQQNIYRMLLTSMWDLAADFINIITGGVIEFGHLDDYQWKRRHLN